MGFGLDTKPLEDKLTTVAVEISDLKAILVEIRNLLVMQAGA